MKKLVGVMLAFLFIPLNAFPTYADEELEKGDGHVGSFTVELSPWEDVDKLIPRYSKFTVIDVDTGLRFNVQRRAGSKHADVQPLTYEDTKIMKKIYLGKWSWKRRAILIHKDDVLIAASMHGMPHGAGALKNGFPGHFCIHFIGSTTHRSQNVDLSHKVMIYKAAGKFDEYIHAIDPYELIGVMMVAMNHDEKTILDTVLTEMQPKERKELHNIVKDIDTISISKIHTESNDVSSQAIISVPVEVDVWNGRSRERKLLEMILIRDGLIDQWRIDAKVFLDEYHNK